MLRYLDLADFLLIAEAVLDVPAEVLALSANLHLAESALAAPGASYGGTELYPAFHEKAAVLCHRLIKNHPLTDGNKRVGYLALREFAARNGRGWTAPVDDGPDGDETVKIIWGVAAGAVDQAGLTEWVRERLGDDTP